VKKEDQTELFFDAYKQKIEIEKYFYGRNTYYIMQLWRDPVKELFILWTHWGEIGTEGEYQRTPFKTFIEARKKFISLFKMKFKYNWSEAHLFKDSKTDPFIQPGLQEAIEIRELVPNLNFSVPMKNSPEVGFFLKGLINKKKIVDDLANNQYQSFFFTISPLHNTAIEEGMKVIEKIKVLAKQAKIFQNKNNFDDYCVKMEQIKRLNNEYFDIVPKILLTHREAILTSEDITREIADLQAMVASTIALRLTVAASKHDSKLNPYDFLFNCLQGYSKWSFLDKNNEEYKLIVRMLNSQKWDESYLIEGVMAVEDSNYVPALERAFDEKPNHWMLYLKISDPNILHLLSSNFEVASMNDKIDNWYVEVQPDQETYVFKDYFDTDDLENNKENYIVMCEVALGNFSNLLLDHEVKTLKPSGFVDTFRIVSNEGPNWESAVIYNGVKFFVEQKEECYKNRVFRTMNNEKFDTFSTLKAYINGKIKKADLREDNGVFVEENPENSDQEMEEDEEADDEEQDDEERNDEKNESEESFENREEKDNHEHEDIEQSEWLNNSEDESNLTIVDRIVNPMPNQWRKDPNVVPLFPNEVTSILTKDLSGSLDNTPATSDYITFNRNSFRVRYIVCLNKVQNVESGPNHEGDENDEEDEEDEEDSEENNEDEEESEKSDEEDE
jgi:predicted DNA-binding WGR domain protein